MAKRMTRDEFAMENDLLAAENDDLECAAARGNKCIAHLKWLLTTLYGRRWNDLTDRQAKEIGEKIQKLELM